MANDPNDPNNQLNIQNNEMKDDPNVPQVNNQLPPVPDSNIENSKDNTPNDQSTTSTSVFGNKSSPHSIFDTVEEESSKDNQSPPISPPQNQTQVEVPQTPDSISNQNEINMNNTLNDNQDFNSTLNSTINNEEFNNTNNSTINNEDVNRADNSTNTTLNNISIFEANIEDDNKNQTIGTQSTNSTINSDLEKKIVSFNESLANNQLNNGTINKEINRLAANVQNKTSILLEVHSNNTKNKSKMNLMKRNRFQLNSSSINTTKSIEQDKQERIRRFYKAYMEKKKELLKKLKEKNKPPIFKVNEISRVKRIKKLKPEFIIKKYESPKDTKITNKNIISKEDTVFGHIHINKRANQINPAIPHYGYIGQQLIYNNLPLYDLRRYKGINEYENLV